MNRKWLGVSLLMWLAAAWVLPACQRMGVGGSHAATGTVHILFSKLNAEKYGYADAERVEDQLRTAGFHVQRIDDEDLAALKGVTPTDVVAINSVYLMSEEAIAALTRFAQAGGGCCGSTRRRRRSRTRRRCASCSAARRLP